MWVVVGDVAEGKERDENVLGQSFPSSVVKAKWAS